MSLTDTAVLVPIQGRRFASFTKWLGSSTLSPTCSSVLQTESELENFDPDFTIINCCSQVAEDWKEMGLHSDTAVVFNIEKKVAVIFGTWYGGENKKGIFSLMNYWLPMHGNLPMHCSANVGKNGDSASSSVSVARARPH
jgi:hypothetical protein